MAEASLHPRVEARARGHSADALDVKSPPPMSGSRGPSAAIADLFAGARRNARTVILFALEQESRPFLRQAGDRKDVDVRVSGMGRKNAEAATRRILAGGLPRHVITTGFAGGLRPDLAVGDIVFETADPAVAKRLVALGGKPARLVTTEHVLVTAEDRRRLRERTGGDVVENESGYVQAICRARGVACTTIRVISDTANQDLPFDFNALAGPDGNVSYCRVMAALLRRPSKLPGLIKLGRQTRIAARRLTAFLEAAIFER